MALITDRQLVMALIERARNMVETPVEYRGLFFAHFGRTPTSDVELAAFELAYKAKQSMKASRLVKAAGQVADTLEVKLTKAGLYTRVEDYKERVEREYIESQDYANYQAIYFDRESEELKRR